MPASTSKRVFLYRFDRQPLEGIVTPTTCLMETHLEVLTLDGNLMAVSYGELKAFCYISENAKPDLFDANTSFERRPKSPGLWARFLFRDSSNLEGVLSHSMLDWPKHGYLVTPPHAGSNRQRVFIPKLAVTDTEMLGVVGKPGSMSRRKAAAAAEQQLPMFE